MLVRGETKTSGIAVGVLAYFVFALHDAAIKLLVVDIPVWQVLFFRSGTILAVCLAIGRRALLEHAAASTLKRPLAFRGVVNLTSWLCYYSAARSLPLAQLLSLYFAAPLGQLLVLALLIPALDLLFRRVDEVKGQIVVSALAADVAWHWMRERWAVLQAVRWPEWDAFFVASVLRWAGVALVLGYALWYAGQWLQRREQVGLSVAEPDA